MMISKAASRPSLFISGVGGFLGSHLADWALNQNYRVIGCDNFASGSKENVPKGVEFYEYDLQDFEKNNKYLKDVDVVFHAAALPYDSLSVCSPYEITCHTYSLTASLLSASIQNNIRRFVFCSSMSRYGNQTSPFTEDMLPKPVTPYGIAKLSGETLLRNLAEIYSFEYVICVPHNIFGPRQRYDDPYRNAVSILINRMLQDKPPIVYGDGEQKRCFSPIKDVVSVFESLLFSDKVNAQVINVGPDREHITINQLIALLNRIMGKSLKPLYIKIRPQEVKKAFCNITKARQLLNYNPQTSFEEALRELVAWVQSKGPKEFSYSRQMEILNEKTPEAWVKKLF